MPPTHAAAGGPDRRFVQVEAAISGSDGGSGLGLAICRQPVRLMGGDITVDSSPCAGTTFSCAIALPPGAPADRSPVPRLPVPEPADA